MLLTILTQESARAQPVRRDYFHGDWVSYVTMRRISGFAQGFDILYIATPRGVGRFHTIARRFLPPLTVSSGLDDSRILRIAYDDGTSSLWVDTPLGPYSYNEVIDEWRRELDFPAQLVRDDAPGLRFENLFTPFELAYHARDQDSPYGLFVDRNLRRYPITTALRDATNRDRIYIGTWGFGVGEIDGNTWQAQFYAYGPYQNTVQAMLRDGESWYFAGRGEPEDPPVISEFRIRDSSWRYMQPFYAVAAKGDVTSMAVLDEFLFFGTPYGLLRYDRKQDTWRKYTTFDGLPGDGITALYPDSLLLWVGTQAGPGLLDPRLDTGQVAISLSTGTIGTPWVYDFVRAYGYVWAGTQSGLYRIRQSEHDWTRIATEEGLLRGHVRAVALQPEGLWCATDAGLLLLDSQLVAQEVFRSRVELTDGNLFALAVDGSNIWASSLSGVWRYIRAKRTWRLYTNGDGLAADFAYDIELDGPYVWFGTEDGVTRFLWSNPMRVD